LKKIKILLDYRCYPIWVYNEKDELISNDLIDELKNEKEIEELLDEIQKTYDSLFIDDGKEFAYKGFEDKTRKKEFLNKVSKAFKLIKARTVDMYIMDNNVNI
jgi:hypothetical protein